ncbi:MAG: D-alanyl-D-alanine carboxypeptidase [Chthonomonadaceae bacterium]|jgi:D-alanyl-D-alanine carboxypeptidase/D-alanyl-D-alanine-endopeptidase (penicillin-binding protein 4)|nr:D-alanyl-D-alanine carboxypeptidase [Chthonomonadaceae bacterium]
MPLIDDHTARLNELLRDPVLSGAMVGVCVQDENGKVVFQRDSDKRFLPASNGKILTCLFAFEELGASWAGLTRVWKEGKRVEVDTTGDPTLTLGQLRRVRKKLSLFDGWPVCVHGAGPPTLGMGWEWDDLPWYYAAPVTLFAFDRGQFEAWSDNGRVLPLAPELQVKVVVEPGSKREAEYDPKTRTLTVSSLGKDKKKLGSFAIGDPLRSAALALGGALRECSDPLPRRTPDAEISGQTLAVGVKECLEKSDNYMAEQYLLLAAARAKPGHTNPAQVEKECLAKWTGASLEDFRPVDGSGLSRHNQVTPRALCTMLRWALTRPYAGQWIEALAAGGEGTLGSRLKSSSFVGKTGTMDAVVCLSGYVTTRDKKRWTLSCLVNNSLVPASQIRDVQDRIVRILEETTVDHGINSAIASLESPLSFSLHRPARRNWLP